MSQSVADHSCRPVTVPLVHDENVADELQNLSCWGEIDWENEFAHVHHARNTFTRGKFGDRLNCILTSLLLFVPYVCGIVVGSLNLSVDSCFDERIAIFLIMQCVFGLFRNVTLPTTKSLHCMTQRKTIKPYTWIHWMCWISCNIIYVFLTVLISLAVYDIWNKVDLDNVKSKFYCDRTLYSYTFFYMVWELLGLICILIYLLFQSIAFILSFRASKNDVPLVGGV